jgi:hypothetical protein
MQCALGRLVGMCAVRLIGYFGGLAGFMCFTGRRMVSWTAHGQHTGGTSRAAKASANLQQEDAIRADVPRVS